MAFKNEIQLSKGWKTFYATEHPDFTKEEHGTAKEHSYLRNSPVMIIFNKDRSSKNDFGKSKTCLENGKNNNLN